MVWVRFSNQDKIRALVDTGADSCLFPDGYIERLGLDRNTDRRGRFKTGYGGVEGMVCYFDLDIEVIHLAGCGKMGETSYALMF